MSDTRQYSGDSMRLRVGGVEVGEGVAEVGLETKLAGLKLTITAWKRLLRCQSCGGEVNTNELLST